MTTVRQTIDAVLGGALDHESALDRLAIAAPATVDPALTAALWQACTRRWHTGWQPLDLDRIVRRRAEPRHAHLVADAVAAHLRGLAPDTVDPRWREQADALGAVLWWTDDACYLDELAARCRLDRVTVLDTAVTLLTLLAALPPVELLLPVPGTARQSSGPPAGRADARALDRVRALLAKAESTGYPAEADAYTAKAQELVTRHRLEDLLPAAGPDRSAVVPFARRIGLDHPYESEKAAVLDAVARANGCHTVWSAELGFATVFGFDADVDAVELLHTSLLVQAHRAMARHEPPGGKAGRARLRAFRQSFLVAFAVRIGQRLAAAAEAVRAEAQSAADPTGAALLPVLAARDEQVREAMRQAFPRTVRSRGARVDSHEGWRSGRVAAEQAALPGAAGPPSG